MAILPKGAAPREGPNSFDQLDQAVLAGFVAPGARTTTGKSKIAAGRIRARITAVELWVVEGEQPQHGVLAQTLGVSDRWLSYHFQSQSELYAFPPPELASSLVEAASSSHEWTNIARLIRPVLMHSNPITKAVRLWRAWL